MQFVWRLHVVGESQHLAELVHGVQSVACNLTLVSRLQAA